MVFQMSQREIAKDKFENCNKNGFINFEQLTARINVFFFVICVVGKGGWKEREVGKF